MGIAFSEWLQVVQLALTVIALLASAGTWLYVRHSNSREAIDGAIKGLREFVDQSVGGLRQSAHARMDSHGDRITRLEAQLGALPTHSDLGDLYERINGVAASVAELVGENKAQRSLLEQMNRYLMESRKV